MYNICVSVKCSVIGTHLGTLETSTAVIFLAKSLYVGNTKNLAKSLTVE
jgi:hypothetical protein